MIIDAHTHLGHDYVFEKEFTSEELLTGMEKNGVDASIVQPGTVIGLRKVVEQHNAIVDLSKKIPRRIFGMANPNPHLPGKAYRGELRRCVEDLGFIGVKLHPFGHSVNPSKSVGRKVFEAAFDLGIPVMVHTGAGVPWALPSALIPVAMDFPELKIILAHCGTGIFSDEAALAARLCRNIYLETSWLPGYTILDFCRTFGADRVMFGSDHSENVATELAKFRTVGLADEELKWCLGKTAAKVFDIHKSG